jgi:hypothetical protein
MILPFITDKEMLIDMSLWVSLAEYCEESKMITNECAVTCPKPRTLSPTQLKSILNWTTHWLPLHWSCQSSSCSTMSDNPTVDAWERESYAPKAESDSDVTYYMIGFSRRIKSKEDYK